MGEVIDFATRWLEKKLSSDGEAVGLECQLCGGDMFEIWHFRGEPWCVCANPDCNDTPERVNSIEP